MFNLLKVEETNSTNSWARLHQNDCDLPFFVYCFKQTAGRGQRGNSWESEPGKNLTGSFVFHPDNFPAARQFLISETVALSVVILLEEFGISAKVKWPNDIYVGDKKICGILVEHMVTGQLLSLTIAGLGININQDKFLSSAPNPVSMKLLTGQTYDIDLIASRLSLILTDYLNRMDNPGFIHSEFMAKLWRNDGKFHRFHDKNREVGIEARIVTVSPEGMLNLQTKEGKDLSFAFKEVEFLL